MFGLLKRCARREIVPHVCLWIAVVAVLSTRIWPSEERIVLAIVLLCALTAVGFYLLCADRHSDGEQVRVASKLPAAASESRDDSLWVGDAALSRWLMATTYKVAANPYYPLLAKRYSSSGFMMRTDHISDRWFMRPPVSVPSLSTEPERLRVTVGAVTIEVKGSVSEVHVTSGKESWQGRAAAGRTTNYAFLAENCMRIAERDHEPMWLTLAQSWLRLAEKIESHAKIGETGGDAATERATVKGPQSVAAPMENLGQRTVH